MEVIVFKGKNVLLDMLFHILENDLSLIFE